MTLDRTVQPQSMPFEQIEFKHPQKQTLPNGTPLYIIQSEEEDVVRMDIVFKAGTSRQTQKLQARFAHRMLKEGSRKYTSAEIAEKLDYYGAWLELSSSMDYAFLTLYALNKYFAEAMEIIESIVKEPTFPEHELQTAIEMNVQQYLVERTRVNSIARRSLMKALFGDQHPAGQYAEEADYRCLTPELLRAFYTKHYHTGNYAIYLSGKVTKDILTHVINIFGTGHFGLETANEEERTYPIVTTTEKRLFTKCENAVQSSVNLGALTITPAHADYAKLRVLITLFGGYFGSRLISNIREDKGYTYGILSTIFPCREHGVLLIASATANEYVEPLIKEVYHEIDRLHSEPIDEEELAVVKNYMLGEMCRNHESAFSLADEWIFIHTNALPDDYTERLVEAIRTATPNELQALAIRYLRKENLKEIIAGEITP
jgi:predicted Zn-dependent peptidase